MKIYEALKNCANINNRLNEERMPVKYLLTLTDDKYDITLDHAIDDLQRDRGKNLLLDNYVINLLMNRYNLDKRDVIRVLNYKLDGLELTEARNQNIENMLQGLAKADFKVGHTFDRDDFSYFKRVCKDDGYKVTEADFERYFEILDELRNQNLSEAANPYFIPYGIRDVRKILNGKAPSYYYHLKEIEMDYGDGVKVANYARKLGFDVKQDVEDNTYCIPGEYHWSDRYFYPYPINDLISDLYESINTNTLDKINKLTEKDILDTPSKRKTFYGEDEWGRFGVSISFRPEGAKMTKWAPYKFPKDTWMVREVSMAFGNEFDTFEEAKQNLISFFNEENLKEDINCENNEVCNLVKSMIKDGKDNLEIKSELEKLDPENFDWYEADDYIDEVREEQGLERLRYLIRKEEVCPLDKGERYELSELMDKYGDIIDLENQYNEDYYDWHETDWYDHPLADAYEEAAANLGVEGEPSTRGRMGVVYFINLKGEELGCVDYAEEIDFMNDLTDQFIQENIDRNACIQKIEEFIRSHLYDTNQLTESNISYNDAQVKAYKILKSKEPYAVIYAYSQGKEKVILEKPLVKQSQEEVNQFVDSFRRGKEATRVVVDVFYLTQLNKIEKALKQNKLIESQAKEVLPNTLKGKKLVKAHKFDTKGLDIGYSCTFIKSKFKPEIKGTALIILDIVMPEGTEKDDFENYYFKYKIMRPDNTVRIEYMKVNSLASFINNSVVEKGVEQSFAKDSEIDTADNKVDNKTFTEEKTTTNKQMIVGFDLKNHTRMYYNRDADAFFDDVEDAYVYDNYQQAQNDWFIIINKHNRNNFRDMFDNIFIVTVKE